MSVDLKSISQLLLKIAPNLATAILGPAGTVVVTLLCHWLGISEDDLTDALGNPDSVNKIKALEFKHGEVLAQIEYEDRADARASAIIGKYDWFVHLFSLSINIGFFVSLYMINFSHGDQQNHDILNILLGVLATNLSQVTSYYYGNIKK